MDNAVSTHLAGRFHAAFLDVQEAEAHKRATLASPVPALAGSRL